jgi:hypothetical protein
MKTLYLSVLSLLTVLNSFGQQGTGPSVANSQAVESKIGRHFRVIPAADGTHEVTLVGNGLNYQDTNGNWIASIPVVQSFSNAIVCTGASYRVLLATNLNTYGSVDMELPTDPATREHGRIVSHPLGIAFYDPDSGQSVLLAQLKDCSAQIVSNKVIFTDAFTGSNGIEGSVTYTYDVGHFHQDVTLTAKPSVTPADFDMGPNARLEMLTEIVQSPTPVITEHTLSAGTRSTTSAMTAQPVAEPAVIDQTLDLGTMRMGMGRAFSTATAAPTASPQNALTVIKRLVSIDSRTVLTEDVPWNKAVESLQSLPQSAAGASAAPQASAKSTLPRQKMLAQMSVPLPHPGAKLSFKERLVEMHRSKPLKLASLNSQLLALSSPRGFVIDYETVETCDYYTFQSGHTYFINSHVEMWYATIESGAVIKLSSGGNLSVLAAINCPDNTPVAVITDMNDDSAGQKISNSLGLVTGSTAYIGLDLSQLDGYPGYVHNLDIRFFVCGIVGPMLGNENDWCYVYDCWFFGCAFGVSTGGPIDSLGVYTSDFCNVSTLFSPSDIYASDNTTCAVDRNGNGLPDAWEFLYFDSLTHSGGELDANGNTLLYDYQHYSNFPSVTISTPVNNSSATTTRVNVTGTFVEPFLKQITVNSVKAFTSGTTFEALNVPLQPGANTVTATVEENSVAAIVKNIAQRTATTSITVNGSSSLVDPVQLTATPVAGFAPVNVSFQIASSAPGTFQQVLYDFEGNGHIDQTANNLNAVSHIYSEGEHFPAVTVVTSAGRFSSPGGWSSADPNRLTVNVQAPPVIQSTISVTDPVDLKTTASGNLYVLSGSTATVLEYDSTGMLLRSLAGIGTGPSGLDVDSAGNVYVAVTGDNQVLKFNPTTSSFQVDTAFGASGHIGKSDKSSGLGIGEFNLPFDVAVSRDGTELAVSDSGNHRIQRFSTTGSFIGAFGQQGSGVGQFNSPKGLAYDTGYLYIVDSGNNRVELAVSGVVVGSCGASGTSLGEFQGAVNLCVGNRGICIADAGNNRVQVFSPLVSGQGISPSSPFIPRVVFSTELGLNHPQAVAATSSFVNEQIYIADTGNNRVLLATLPLDDATPVWNSMKQTLLAGDVNGVSQYFSTSSTDKYRQAFLSMGQTTLSTIISQIPALSLVEIESNTAEYRFDKTIQGVIITFPVDFIKENGIWKISSF